VILPQPPRLYLAAAGCEEGRWCCLSAAAGTARTRSYLFAPKLYHQGTSIHQATDSSSYEEEHGKGVVHSMGGRCPRAACTRYVIAALVRCRYLDF